MVAYNFQSAEGRGGSSDSSQGSRRASQSTDFQSPSRQQEALFNECLLEGLDTNIIGRGTLNRYSSTIGVQRQSNTSGRNSNVSNVSNVSSSSNIISSTIASLSRALPDQESVAQSPTTQLHGLPVVDDRTRDAHLKVFLLEQIALHSQGKGSDYYAITLRKALRNVGNAIIITPEDARKVKGVGAKTVQKYIYWLADRGVVSLPPTASSTTTSTSNARSTRNAGNTGNTGNTTSIQSAISTTGTTDSHFNPTASTTTLVNSHNSIGDGSEVEEYSQEVTEKSVSRKRKRYAPKDGSIPATVLHILRSYFDKHKSFPSRYEVVRHVQQRHSNKQKTTVLNSIRSMAVNQGVVVEVNGKIELTTQGWEIVGGQPSYLLARRGEIKRKAVIPPPSIAEIAEIPGDTHRGNSVYNEDTFDVIPSQLDFPIKMSYVEAEGNVVSRQEDARRELISNKLLYYVSIVFPLQREAEVRSRIRIDELVEMQKECGLGMVYGWIPDVALKESPLLGEYFFPTTELQRRSLARLRQFEQTFGDDTNHSDSRSMPLDARDREDSSSVHGQVPTVVCHQTDVNPPKQNLITNPGSNIVTFSRATLNRRSHIEKRNRLMSFTSRKLSLNTLQNINGHARPHTSTFNRILHDEKEFEILLIVDKRERLGHDRNAFFGQVQQTIHSTAHVLSLGDFVWVAKPVHGALISSFLIDIVAERKTADDLAHSIRDGRKKNQNFRMQKIGFSRIYYLVEGVLSQRERFSPSALNQSITNMIIRDRFRVIQTSSDIETMEVLYNLTEVLISKIKEKGLDSCLLQQDGRTLTLGDYGQVGNKENYHSFSEILGRQLYSLKRCTGDAAISIVNTYPTVLHLHNALEALPSSRRKNLLVESVVIPSQGYLPAERVSKVLSKQVCDLFTLDSYEEGTIPHS